jgi:YesN/AraC family two-component response regulator
VLEADNTEAALRIIGSTPVDLVALDVVMPGETALKHASPSSPSPAARCCRSRR